MQAITILLLLISSSFEIKEANSSKPCHTNLTTTSAPLTSNWQDCPGNPHNSCGEIFLIIGATEIPIDLLIGDPITIVAPPCPPGPAPCPPIK